MEIKKLAQALCDLLEGDWKINEQFIKDRHPGIFIENENSHSLHISIPWNKSDRYEIDGIFRGNLPRFIPYGDMREKTSISVSQSKTPEQISKDITKRLLPAYERMFAAAKESKARNDKLEHDKQYTLEIIKSILGEDARISNDQCFYHAAHKNVTVQYYYDGDIKLDIIVPFQKAVEILNLL